MTIPNTRDLSALSLLLAGIFAVSPATVKAQSGAVDSGSSKTITGQAAFADFSQQRPGVRRKITVADLPAPNEAESVDNGPTVVPRPEGAWPIAPAGFKVELYAQGFTEPRLIRTAPNGDLFLADSKAGKGTVLRGVGSDGKVTTTETFASDLDHPFGIAFYPSGDNPQWVYVANTTSVVRFPYKSGDTTASANPETVVAELPHGRGHSTRDVVFTRDDKVMLVSVGSA